MGDAITTGHASATAKDCLALCPHRCQNALVLDVPLEMWNEEALHDLCFSDLFPKIWDDSTFSELRKLLSNHADTAPLGAWSATSDIHGLLGPLTSSAAR